MARTYKLKFADGAPVDDAFLDFIDGMFSELKVTPEMAQAMADKWQAYVGQRVQSEAAASQRELDALKAELGAGYDQAVAAGQRGARSMGLKAADLDKLQGALGVPPVVRLMVAIGKRFEGAGGGNDPLSSPEQARGEIERLQRSPAWAKKLFDPKAEGHAEAKERWQQLHAAAFPAAEPAAAPANPAPAGGDDAAAKARGRINELIGDSAFMGSLRDPSHPEHQANRAQFDNLHVEAGITR